MPEVVGLDIGGANLKAAHVDGWAMSRPFALWKAPSQLPDELRRLIESFPRVDALAITMTAELADCYATKAEGVDCIVDAVRRAADGRKLLFWQTSGEFVGADVAREFPRLTAAANWHALATWAGAACERGRPALLVDIGTTTTDLIPLSEGRPCTQGLTDPERLLCGELVYTGVRRTPLCALATRAPYRDRTCRVASEWVATTLDVYLTTGDIEEADNDRDTADGRPATRAAALDRLARMFCADRVDFADADAVRLAAFYRDVQEAILADAMGEALAPAAEAVNQVILSGRGAFLGERVVRKHPRTEDAVITRLDQWLPPAVSEAACAFAVARLASERCF